MQNFHEIKSVFCLFVMKKKPSNSIQFHCVFTHHFAVVPKTKEWSTAAGEQKRLNESKTEKKAVIK